MFKTSDRLTSATEPRRGTQTGAVGSSCCSAALGNGRLPTPHRYFRPGKKAAHFTEYVSFI
jgi:hypothetical protein